MRWESLGKEVGVSGKERLRIAVAPYSLIRTRSCDCDVSTASLFFIPWEPVYQSLVSGGCSV